MRFSASASLLLPALISAHMAWRPDALPSPTFSLSQPTQTLSPSEQIPESPSITTIPTSTSQSTTHSPSHSQSHLWDPLLSGASSLLSDIDEIIHPDLKKRQGAIGATNVVPATTQPTQMPPVTAYDLYGTALVYTQTFPAVPDPWPAAGAGAIGLGGIAGEVGVVKTNSKRSEPTGTVTATAGQVVKIKGREVTMS